MRENVGTILAHSWHTNCPLVRHWWLLVVLGFASMLALNSGNYACVQSKKGGGVIAGLRPAFSRSVAQSGSAPRSGRGGRETPQRSLGRDRGTDLGHTDTSVVGSRPPATAKGNPIRAEHYGQRLHCRTNRPDT